jgi:pseudouridine-5'-phosphate glycosidase
MAKTLEVLDTAGVPVVGFGTDAFPAFWSRASGLKCPLRLDSPAQIASFWAARKALGQEGGMLIANPIPETDEIAMAEMRGYIDAALDQAENENIGGKAVTPFLLSRILELSAGRSLTANIALVENNARVAARIAVAVAG